MSGEVIRCAHGSPIYTSKLKVKQCRIRRVYSQDAEKFNVLSISGEGKVGEKTKRRHVEYEASYPKMIFCSCKKQEDELLHKRMKRKRIRDADDEEEGLYWHRRGSHSNLGWDDEQSTW